MGLLTNIYLAYNFNSSSGTTVIDGTGSFNASFNPAGTPPTWTTGKIGNGLMFNGGLNGSGTSRLDVPGLANLGFGTADFSISFFIKPNNTSTYWIPFSFGYESGTGTMIEYDIALQRFYVYFNATNITTILYTITPGSWYHIVLRRIGTQFSLFVNGSLAGTLVNSTNITEAGLTKFIGQFQGGEVVNGTIDMFYVYKGYGLSNAEITQLYNGGAGLEYPFSTDSQKFFLLS